MIAEPCGFDREAFRAAARKAAEPSLVGVNLPGIGAAWVRPLSAGDWVDSHSVRASLEKRGVEFTPRLRMAVGLAQNLCGPDGAAIFDANSLEDLQTLAALPLDKVADALAKAGEMNAAPEGSDPNV
jgi:hypothetical protein